MFLTVLVLHVVFLVGTTTPVIVSGLRVQRLIPKMSLFSLPSLPLLCLNSPPVSTSTSDDPTAGMTDDQIASYVSNVGGGLCGSNDAVKTVIGLSLNLSLIVFGRKPLV
jgi:hypothetical protein